MRVRVLGCSGGCVPGKAPSCYLLGDSVAVDAGALATALTLEEQRDVTDVFLTHGHWDHVRDLPLTVINRDAGTPALNLHGLPATLEGMRTHLMNEVIWFRAFELPSLESPFIWARPLVPGDVHEAGGFRISAFEVPHTVPAISYLIDDGSASVVISGDTGGGRGFGDLPPHEGPLRAVFLETSFPNAMRDFAVLTGHLTPEMLAEEVRELPEDVHVYVTHMKPGFEARIEAELAQLTRANVRACRDGEAFTF